MEMIENCVSLPEQEQASRQPQQLPAFTPGPWSAGAGRYIKQVKHTSLGRETRFVAECVTALPLVEGEREANAHLIAAAPDMYAALQDCLEHCEKEGGPDVEFIRDDNSGHMLNVEMIRAALRKARGER
jgi:hypothetical protein